jgi:hypothetical protein
LKHSLTSCRRAPFTYDAWHSKEVLDKISEVAGIELVPVMDAEISAVNIAVNESNSAAVPDKERKTDEEVSAFAWHFDSYPFVCVTMLSDCTGMIGGETALKTGTGEIMKVRGPAMVCANDHIQSNRDSNSISGNCCCHAR